MRIMIFRGERSIADLADNIYASLTPKTRVVAETTLLDANPQLKAIGRVKPGTILKAPVVPGIAFNANQSHADPVGLVAESLLPSLGAYQSQFKEAIKESRKKLDQEAELLGNKRLDPRGDVALQQLFVAAKGGLKKRAERLKNLENAMTPVFDQLTKELKNLLR